MAGIYCITINGNSKKYIGSSVNLQIRRNAHINMLRKNKHFNKPLQYSFNKYGENNYNFEILEVTQRDNVIQLEQKHIDSQPFDCLYNVCKLAGDTSKMIESRKGGRLTLEHKIKISKGLLGRVCSESTKDKLSKSHSGKTLSKEHKEKLRKSHLNKKISNNHKQNISKSILGNVRNDNTSGFVGVQLIKSSGRYAVRIKNKSYGCYTTKEEAIIKAKDVYASLGKNIGGVSSQL